MENGVFQLGVESKLDFFLNGVVVMKSVVTLHLLALLIYLMYTTMKLEILNAVQT